MRIRVETIKRHRDEVLALGDVQGEWLVIPDSRRSEYEATFRRIRGLGDAVEVFAKPVAALLGKGNCGGCAERRDKLNKLLPL